MLRRLLLAAICAAPLGALSAQTPATPGHAVLRGVAVDSIRGGLLRGATVGVLGPSRMTFTDSLGRFTIDSIPPGEYRVALFDPLLDTLSLGVVSAPTRFAAGDTVTLTLAIPSQFSIVTAKCGPARSADEDRALVGQVLDAATERPVEGAQVTLTWTDLTISEAAGIRSEPRRRHSETDARGFYKICGLPAELTAEAFVQRGADSTGKVQLAFGDALLALATFLLPGSSAGAADAPARPADTTRTASVAGTVTDDQGSPIENAHVSVVGGDATTTDSTGAFSLTGQPTGTHPLIVRRLGYTPVELAVNLTPLRLTELTVELGRYVPMLAAVMIDARREAGLESVGFTARKARGTGTFIERKFIEQRNAFRLGELLENIPALRRPGDGFGGTCTTYFVDGVHWRSGTPGDFIMPDEIEAIEVYTRSFTPGEFQTFDRCTTVAIWTRWKLRL